VALCRDPPTARLAPEGARVTEDALALAIGRAVVSEIENVPTPFRVEVVVNVGRGGDVEIEVAHRIRKRLDVRVTSAAQ